ncbi:hypothetical protein ACFSMW_14720 [Virgibacillus halophilus]|uniref:Uncharacterized protein n=1 Tax=Tigheibacillus halophilus TaxID=361280 RepID=A0ABU5CBT8_9BACI|nr:hypothetical protein [Virgibacillus halophilus]
MNKNYNEQDNMINGLALGITFVIVSGFLYYYPSFLYFEVASYITGASLGIIGLVGMLSEIGKMIDKQYKDALRDVSSAVALGIIVFVLYYYFSNRIVNIIILILSIALMFGFLRGVLRIFYIIINQQNLRNSFIRLSIFILNLMIFTLTILQILQIIKIIK